MNVSGIAINTAMFATCIRIHTVTHTHIFTFNFIYNRFRLHFYVLRFYILLFPIIYGFHIFLCEFIFYKTVFGIKLCATSILVLHFFSLLICFYFMMILLQFFAHVILSFSNSSLFLKVFGAFI